MPAVTFRHSTTHSSQNCGVVIARSAVTLPVVDHAPASLRARCDPARPPIRAAERER